MKNKMHQTQSSKAKKDQFSFKIKVDPTTIPNKLHLETQIKYSAKVHEDKRFKKPKHKNKLFEE